VTSAIKITDMKRLLLESGGICAFPGCHRPLVSAEAPEEPGAVIAEVAHIVAESREGPRGRLIDCLDSNQKVTHELPWVPCPLIVFVCN